MNECAFNMLWLLYGISAISLFLLVYCDPERRRLARLTPAKKLGLSWVRFGLYMAVFAPFLWAIYHVNTAHIMISSGFVFVLGWCYVMLFKVHSKKKAKPARLS